MYFSKTFDFFLKSWKNRFSGELGGLFAYLTSHPTIENKVALVKY